MEAKRTKGRFIYIMGQIFGWFFLVLGFLGIILPVLPGWPLIFVGLLILGVDVALRDKIIGLFPQKIRPLIRKQADRIYKRK